VRLDETSQYSSEERATASPPTELSSYFVVLPDAGFATTRKLTLMPLEVAMNGLIYLIGLIVVIMFILSFLGLR
jgi:hypothetical protein